MSFIFVLHSHIYQQLQLDWLPIVVRFMIVVGTNVSLINIFFVALYQLITIRIDPFGVRNIITTPRCFVACIASWLTALFGVKIMGNGNYNRDAELVATISQMVYCCFTGASICLIYHAVAKAPCNDNIQMIERNKENKQLLRTFVLVYGTTLISATLSLALSIILTQDRTNVISVDCLYFIVILCGNLNLITNSVVYWWRLKEFRSILFCNKIRVVPINIDERL